MWFYMSKYMHLNMPKSMFLHMRFCMFFDLFFDKCFAMSKEQHFLMQMLGRKSPNYS